MTLAIYVRAVQKEEGLMGGLHVAKDEEMDLEMDMELSGGSGSAHLDGLLSFADVDDDHKPQHSGHDQPPDAAQPSGAAGGNAKKKRYHRHTALQIQQMEAYGFHLHLLLPLQCHCQPFRSIRLH